MTFDKAQKIFEALKSTKLDLLKNDVTENCLRYAHLRAEWYLMSDDDKRNNEDTRTRTHNTLIDSCNILSREMIKRGEDANWRNELGGDRKEIGDFACYIHCLLGLYSR